MTCSSISFVSAQENKTGVIVPLYADPDSNYWAHLVNLRMIYPDVPLIAIINPDNGPGYSFDIQVSNGIQILQDADIKVIGYIHTNYGQRDLSIVTDEISRYHNLYQVDGIFFDEVASSGKEIYYKNLKDYANTEGLQYTVGNPGIDIPESYVGILNNYMIHENNTIPTLGYLGGWHSDYDKSNFSIALYGIHDLDESYVMDARSYLGYIYITDDDLPNPWDTLPSYLNRLLSILSS